MLKSYTVFLSVVLFVPIATLVLTSVAPTEYVALPGPDWTMRWYVELFGSARLLGAIRNSLVIAACASALSTITGAMAAMAMAHLKPRYRDASGFVFGGIAAMPVLFVALPALVLLAWTGVPRGSLAVIAVLATVVLPLTVFIVLARLARVDSHLREAAWLLGASAHQTEWFVIVPLLRRPMLTSFMLAYMVSFDDVVVAYFLGGNTETFPTALYSMTRFGLSPVMMAGCTIILAGAISLVLAAALIEHLASRTFGHR